MTINEQFERAKGLAHLFHAEQFRRDGVTPYTNHTDSVGMNADEWFGAECGIVGHLHDILEDTTCPLDTLTECFSMKVVDGVIAMTRQADESYNDYINRATKNDLARKVKAIDNIVNLQDAPTSSQTDKYAHSLSKLSGIPMIQMVGMVERIKLGKSFEDPECKSIVEKILAKVF